MNYLVLLVGLVAGAIWLPFLVAFTTGMISDDGGGKLKANLKLYAILGALIGLMAGLGVIQADIGVYGLLIGPGLILALTLVELILLAIVVLVILVLQSICAVVTSLI
jgi:hypothetical protein